MGKQVIYEDVLRQAGDLGIYQVAIFAYMGSLAFLTVETIFMNFIGYRMDHWCKVPELANFSFEFQKQLAIPYTIDSNTSFEQCERFDVDYSGYSEEELFNLPRPTNAEVVQCSEWVYDQSVYSNNIVNEVRNVHTFTIVLVHLHR